MNTETVTFGLFFFCKFLYNYGYCKEITKCSEFILIMYRSLLGLKTELHEYENEIWEVSRLITQNQCPLDQVRVLCELL